MEKLHSVKYYKVLLWFHNTETPPYTCSLNTAKVGVKHLSIKSIIILERCEGNDISNSIPANAKL